MSNYPVILLIEQALTELDATQVTSLHTGVEGGADYTVLLPVEDAAGRVEAAMGALGSGEVVAPMALSSDEYIEMQQELLTIARDALQASLTALNNAGASASGTVVTDDPVHALVVAVASTTAREAIVLTRPHVVAEFFHVDWTSRARRKLGVPVLHLLEHETFEEQSGHGQGMPGI